MAVYIDNVQVGTIQYATTVDLSSMFTLIGIVLMMIVEISLIKAIKKR